MAVNHSFLSQSINSDELRIRTMRNSDLDLVAQNESATSEHPWNKRIFVDCLRSGYQCWVLVGKDSIVGHGVMSVAIGESHLLTLCIAPAYQRLGHGRRLLRFLLERAARLQAEVCFLEVRPSNQPAQLLYKSMGFLPIGERKNYYPASGGREDALIMSLRLSL
ncbi:MAG: ribosomal protein S18-alanine N-acetyltransferase [Pseudohongiellaceae bacterium]